METSSLFGWLFNADWRYCSYTKYHTLRVSMSDRASTRVSSTVINHYSIDSLTEPVIIYQPSTINHPNRLICKPYHSASPQGPGVSSGRDACRRPIGERSPSYTARGESWEQKAESEKKHPPSIRKGETSSDAEVKLLHPLQIRLPLLSNFSIEP